MYKYMQLTARKQQQKQHLLIVASHYYHYKQHNYFCPNLKILYQSILYIKTSTEMKMLLSYVK